MWCITLNQVLSGNCGWLELCIFLDFWASTKFRINISRFWRRIRKMRYLSAYFCQNWRFGWFHQLYLTGLWHKMKEYCTWLDMMGHILYMCILVIFSQSRHRQCQRMRLSEINVFLINNFWHLVRCEGSLVWRCWELWNTRFQHWIQADFSPEECHSPFLRHCRPPQKWSAQASMPLRRALMESWQLCFYPVCSDCQHNEPPS